MAQRKGVLTEIAKRPASFAGAFFVLFVLMFVFLSAVGATPDPIQTDTGNQSPVSTNQLSNTGTPEAPVRIVAPAVGLDVPVVNPSSSDVAILDEALKSGAVRYPTSAQLGVNGTVVLFGHSSYLPVIIHQYYKTFDGIQNLKTGETVSVYSFDREYRYKVVGVRVANANDDVIEMPQDAMHLTLVTCDSFSQKSNRFVVTADFVGAYELN